MTILPNLDIIVLQRRGEILKYDHVTKQVKQVGFLNVYWKTEHTPGVNAEEGLLGISKDPHFAQNHWVYIYYSPKDTSVNRLSRFTFENDTIDLKSEKIILQLYEQREICCHTGGSIAFGPDGLLYFSAGDNSTPFNERGAKFVSNSFAPLNDIPGHQQYDSRRSAGNTNDLRGKINRIRVMDDGTYQIPDGNLFPKGEANTRPEIYVMGDRNPYRISVDQKTGFLYWGEVGPDANNDSMQTRGPRGYDEINQARKAGFFGWPLFIGDNYPYRQFDYATGKSGNLFDPAHPVNDSRNNTGLKDLPPAQPAFIWYPYAASPDFPELGSGGRTAMAGPVYYTSMFPEKTRLPEYYNGKLFIYDWIRGWIMAVTMLPNGDFDEMEPFMEHIKLHNCSDMEVGPDGKLYLLEYGTGWFQKNPDAGLSVIDYNKGNRAPEIKAIHVDKTSGLLPLQVKATVDARDPDKDKISYVWTLGSQKKTTTSPQLDYTFNTAGDYAISVEVKDEQGASAKSDAINVYAGNATPEVKIQLTGGNKSFYLPGVPVKYAVSVKDNDTSKIDLKNLFVTYDYKKDFVEDKNPEGHAEEAAPNVSGKMLTQTLDCKNCHKEDEKSVGPAFMLVSKKYATNPKAHDYLSQKIRNGGAGVWGEVAMAAHPDISQKDLDQIIAWIFSLSDKNAKNKSLPQEGSIIPPAKEERSNASLVLTASYTDKPGDNIKPLTGNALVSLGSNYYSFTGKEKLNGFTMFNFNGNQFLVLPHSPGWFSLNHTDLTDVRSIDISIGSRGPLTNDFPFVIKLDSPEGKVIGNGAVPKKEGPAMTVHVNIDPVTDGNFHDIYFVYQPVKGTEEMQAGVSSVRFNGK
jgi:glucose/arabinose dehydrogenase/cytochrome c551/c552